MLKLHVLRAHTGDCFILEFAKNNNEPKYILIDGGTSGTFRDYLQPYLLEQSGIEFELVVVTHLDDDHIMGISKLLDKIYSQGFSLHKLVKIKELWYNDLGVVLESDEVRKSKISRALETPKIFEPEFDKNIDKHFVEFMELDEPEFITRSWKSGIEFEDKLKKMHIPFNKGFKNEMISLDSSNLTREFDEHLKLKIIGPFQEQLDTLLDKWTEWLVKNAHKLKNVNLRKTNEDKTPPNLSSIMFLAEADGKTILFTGDGRGDHIINGLRERNILTGKTIEVDVLKCPHHGSDRNITEEFFKTILTKTYVISGNGDYHNPHANTLIMIAKVAKSLGRKITIYITYAVEDIDDSKDSGKNRKKRLQTQLEEFQRVCPKDKYTYELKFIDSDKDVLTLVLSE